MIDRWMDHIINPTGRFPRRTWRSIEFLKLMRAEDWLLDARVLSLTFDPVLQVDWFECSCRTAVRAQTSMWRGTELVLIFKDLSNAEENEWETTAAKRTRAEESKHSCPTWAAARALLWSCRFRASWSWAAFRSWWRTWTHAATGMKEGQLMERGGIWHLWSKTDSCSHLGILELGVYVMMSFPQLFIFLPQVKHTVCKPKARHVKDRTQHFPAEHPRLQQTKCREINI